MQETLTHNEIEQLAKLYLDCRLSRLQEKELQLILANTEYSSATIDEARELMGIVSTLKTCGHRYAKPHKRQRNAASIARRWTGIAAAAAIVVILSIYFVVTHDRQRDLITTGDNYVAVYIDGNKLQSQEQAINIAIETRNACMAMMETYIREATLQQQQSSESINNIITQSCDD